MARIAVSNLPSFELVVHWLARGALHSTVFDLCGELAIEQHYFIRTQLEAQIKACGQFTCKNSKADLASAFTRRVFMFKHEGGSG